MAENQNNRFNVLLIIFSSIALLSGGFSIIFSTILFFLLPPLHLFKGLNSFDFSTPENAIKSESKILHDQNFLALIQLSLIREEENKSKSIEKLRSLKFAKSKDGKNNGKILFVTFTENGKEKKDVLYMKKYASSNMWLTTNRYDVLSDEDSLSKTTLGKEISEWKKDFNE